MARWSKSTLLSVFVMALVGCGESYQPVKRESAPRPQPVESAAPAELATATTGAAAPGAAEPGGPEVDLPALRLTAPDKWVRKPPRSGFVLAEFSLPKAEGDQQDGRLTVSTAGGSITDNLERWRKQFGDKPQKETKDEVQLGGVTVTVVDFSGKFNDQAGPMAPGVEREGYRMLGAIIPLQSGLYFVKAYGPEKTMAAQADQFRAFLKTLQVK